MNTLQDEELVYIPVSKSLTRKVLISGVERYYLKFAALPFLIAIPILNIMDLINFVTIIGIVINFAVLMIIGRHLAKKNPYWVEMTIRYFGYKSIYLAQGKYTTAAESPFGFKRVTRGFRTHEDIMRE